MKTYEYLFIDSEREESDEELLARVNKLAKEGWRYLSETIYEKGSSRILLEKTYE